MRCRRWWAGTASPSANSALWSTSTVVETVVPLAAAALFAVVSPASLIAVDALSYVASAALIRDDRAAAVRGAAAGRAAVPVGAGGRRPRGSGVPLVARDRPLDDRGGAAQSIAGGAFVGQMVVWADRDLDVREGDWRLGVVFSSWGIGVLVTSLLMPRLVRRLGAARVTLLALPASAVLCVADHAGRATGSSAAS